MRRAAGPAVALVLAAGLVGGCAGTGWHAPVSREATTPPRDAGRRSEAASLVERAAAHLHEGRPLAARELYERVIRDYPDDPARAEALFGLGLVHCEPGGTLRDYRAAYTTFGRLLAEHPRSRWNADARRWRAMLGEVLARDEEAVRLRGQLERLKRIEVELDRSR